ncbi:hypothetical protein [Clostridium gasigenes]|uniref:hypothetical protein n=1 Tax=Clostridium gasigenes TaxID=94869 RepID=UPI001C0BA250|nr:hypothetical protein [Clostridium gasigenes]MBU3107124.1 hypothetical protein [Clostridium gasigenes]
MAKNIKKDKEEYKIKKFNIKVYVDDIEKWQECEVIDFKNSESEIMRATVLTKRGTQLNRICKNVLSKEYIKKDGCIYFWEK